MTEAVAVLDVGITNLKLLAIDRAGKVLVSRKTSTPVSERPPYRHMDVDRSWDWILQGLRNLANTTTVQAIIPCTHGSGAALIDDTDLVLPVMHYEAEPPHDVAAGYADLAPPFAEVFAPTNPGGLTLARQLFWQQSAFPDAFAQVRHILCYPQYWAWRLCGVAASEVTSLGAQTHLWAPGEGDFSSLVDGQGWRNRFPPLRKAWESLGPIRPEISAHTGLPPATPVLCGIHDSNANYLRYLAGARQDFSLMSTGTWIINFNRSFPLAQLVADYDTNTNSDVYGRPVACSRFMGGREYGLLADATDMAVTPAELERVIAAGTLALPSFSDSGGPFPGTGGKGRIVGPVPHKPITKTALATLYTALMAQTALGHIGTANDIIIDGTFAANEPFCGLLAALHPNRSVWLADQPDGSAQGAALLWGWEQRTTSQLNLRRVKPLAVKGITAYAERWHHSASQPH